MSNPTVLEYARYHGLAIDHHAAFAEQKASLIQQISYGTEQLNPEKLWEDAVEETSTIFAHQTSVLVEDRLQLTLEQSDLLKNAVAPPQVDLRLHSRTAWQGVLPDHKHFQKLRLDQPLLHTGYETVQKDMYRARKGVNIAAIVRDMHRDWKITHEESRPLEDLQNDIALDCTGSATETLAIGLKEDRLLITEDAVRVLRSVLQENHFNMTSCTYLEHPHPRGRLRSISPLPALVISDFSADGDVPVTSVQESAAFSGSALYTGTLPIDHKTAGKQEMVKTIYSSPKSVELSMCSIAKPDKIENVTSDASVGPDLPSRSIFKRSHSSEAQLSTTRTSKRRKHLTNAEATTKLNLEDAVSSQTQTDNAATTLLQSLKPKQSPDLLVKIETAVDREMQCVDARTDTIKVASGQTSDNYLSQSHSDHVKSRVAPEKITQRWLPPTDRRPIDDFKTQLSETLSEVTTLKIGQQQEGKMSWTPFPLLSASNILNEKIEKKQDYLKKVNTGIDDVLKSNQILWKSCGLRVLDASESDTDDTRMSMAILNSDESDPCPETDKVASTETPSRPTCLTSTCAISPAVSNGIFSTKKTLLSCTESALHVPEQLHVRHGEQLQESAFSASSSLSAFLDLRGRKFSKPKLIPSKRVLELKDDPIESTPQSDQAHDREGSSTTKEHTGLTDADAATCRERNRLSLHQPLTWRRTIVVNNSLLEHNPGLVQFCEFYGEDMLNIIYRDLDIQDRLSPDIVLGPNACLIITNVQSLRQRSLPGQKSTSKISLIHQKLLKLMHTHETVIVVVGWSNVTDVDTIIIAEMSAFCTSLFEDSKCHIRPIYVPYTTIDELKTMTNAWVWHTIHEHAFPSLTTKEQITEVQALSLVQDETTWELFLRKAGMNVVAAQIVLDMTKSFQTHLRGDDEAPGKNLETFSSLSCFVQMTLEERLMLFDSVVGSSVLQTVGSLLERVGC